MYDPSFEIAFVDIQSGNLRTDSYTLPFSWLVQCGIQRMIEGGSHLQINKFLTVLVI